MPIASFDFTLPQEQSEYEITANAGKLCSVISDLRDELRALIENEVEKETAKTKAMREAYTKVREILFELVKDNGIDSIF